MKLEARRSGDGPAVGTTGVPGDDVALAGFELSATAATLAGEADCVELGVLAAVAGKGCREAEDWRKMDPGEARLVPARRLTVYPTDRTT